MKSCFECLACLARNAADIAENISDDDAVRLDIVRRSMHALAESDMSMPPPFHLHRIWDIAESACECYGRDPYRVKKELSIDLALRLKENLDRIPGYDPGCFESRMRLATAGNILDFGIYSNLDMDCAIGVIKKAFDADIDRDKTAFFEEKVLKAQRIMYLLDNCGEAVFDRVFMEPYLDKVTFAVRGSFTLNDMTRNELSRSGFDGCRVVDNGSNIPGTITDCCSSEFMDVFDSADLVIAKGQGNFETLESTERPVAFLFLAKCPVVCRLLGAAQNSVQVIFKNMEK